MKNAPAFVLMAWALAGCEDHRQGVPASAAVAAPAMPACAGSAAPAAGHGRRPGPTFFVVGVWSQPVETMDVWKARGINTLVQIPQGHDGPQWVRAADGKGLFQIRSPSRDLASDIKDDHLLAWATTDEPSNKTGVWFDYGHVAQDPAAVVQEAAPWRAAAQAAGRFVPIWTNHVGPHIYPDWAQHNALMQDYMQGPESDWLSSDGYPLQGREPFVVHSNDGYTSTTQGIALDRQRAWSGGKPVMTFIGVSAFNDGAAAPTVGEFNAMAWSSVIHGAAGIVYFPVHLPPAWSFDATPTELVRAITAFDRQIAGMNDILMDGSGGGRRPFRVFPSANAGAPPAAGQLPYPFEAAEIATGEGAYRIVLNLTNQDRVLDKPEWGLNKVTLHGYGVTMVREAAGRPDQRAPAICDPVGK